MENEELILNGLKEIKKYLQILDEKINDIKHPSQILYNNKTLAKYLMVSEKTLKKYRDEGAISYSHPGDKFIYTQQDVDQFIKRFKRIPSGEYE